MSEEFIEVSAKTIEEAITIASQKLSVTSDMLDVEVIDQGSSGFLGFNAKPAIIHAKAKAASTRADHVQGDVLSEVHNNDKSMEAAAQTNYKSDITDDEGAAGAVHKEGITSFTENNGDSGEGVSVGRDTDAFSSSRYPEDDEAWDQGIDNNRTDDTSYRKGSRRSYQSSYNSYSSRRQGEKNYVAHSRSTDDFLSTSSESSYNSRKSRRSRQDRYDADHRYDHHNGYSRNRSYEFDVDEITAPVPESHPRKHDNEPKVNYTDEQITMFEQRAESFLKNMFAAMELEVTITSTFDRDENILTVDFEGDDMGILIGKRGQTLDSIQYLVSLVVNKGVPGYVHVKADTENYRERRKKTLENLAKNMAVKVKKTRKAQALEPMNPYERRIIHSALQGDRYVTTYSEGEDPYRRVVITLKK